MLTKLDSNLFLHLCLSLAPLPVAILFDDTPLKNLNLLPNQSSSHIPFCSHSTLSYTSL